MNINMKTCDEIVIISNSGHSRFRLLSSSVLSLNRDATPGSVVNILM